MQSLLCLVNVYTLSTSVFSDVDKEHLITLASYLITMTHHFIISTRNISQYYIFVLGSKPQIYFMALIDVLTNYGSRKRAAHAAKTMKHGVGHYYYNYKYYMVLLSL